MRKNVFRKIISAPSLYVCILVFSAVLSLFVSCAPLAESVGSGRGASGSGGTTGGNNSQITIRLPPIGSTAIRALNAEQLSRLQRETQKYRVVFSNLGATITREGTNTTYSAVFPVGSQVGVTVYCLNASGEVIVESVTKTITVSTGANSLSFKLSEDGREIVPTPGPQPDPGPTPGPTPDPEPTPDPGPTPEPTPQPDPTLEYINATFYQGWVCDTVNNNTWTDMTGAVLPSNGKRVKDSSTVPDKGTASGYIFKGWGYNYKPNDGIDPDGVDCILKYEDQGQSSGAISLYGIWEKLEAGKYPVRFNVGSTPGSTVTGMPSDKQENANDQVFVDVPACPGYVHTGWTVSPSNVQLNEGSSGSGEYTFDMPAAEVTLTAQWTPINYTIVYKNSQSQDPSVRDTSSFTLASGSTVTLKGANTFTKKGNTLVKWHGFDDNYFDAGATVQRLALIKGGNIDEDPDNLDNDEYRIITLDAEWEANEYTITYMPNAPAGTTVTISDDFRNELDELNEVWNYDAQISGNMIVCKRYYENGFYWINFASQRPFTIPSGYNFRGWAEDKDETMISISTDDQEDNPTYTERDANITVYAIWEQSVSSGI